MPQPETHNEAEHLLQELLTTHLLLYSVQHSDNRNRLEERHARLFDRLAGLVAEALEDEPF